MKKIIALLLLLAPRAIAADNILLPPGSGEMFLKDNNGDIYPAQVSYISDGNGNPLPFSGIMPVGDTIYNPPYSGRSYLNAADGKQYPIVISYTTDGNGNVVPITVGGGGGVASVTATAPLENTGTAANPILECITATGSVAGCLSPTDWTTFNNKQDALGYVPLNKAGDTMTGDLTIGANLTYGMTDNGVSGTNANMPAHSTAFTRLVNNGLVSLASIDITGVTSGHLITIFNDTGNPITIVDNYGSVPGGSSPIITGFAEDIILPSGSLIQLLYDTTGMSAWHVGGIVYSKAKYTGYTATTALDWDWTTLPTTVMEALDSIASYIKTALATKTYTLSMVGGMPSGVYPTQGNKFDFRLSKEGLQMQSHNLPAQTTGAYNGTGTGNKGILGFSNYNNLAFNSLTRLKFEAKNVRDESVNPGNIYWNILANFNTGATSLATDYVNLAFDGLEQHLNAPPKFYKLTTSMDSYDITAEMLNTERIVKAVGGTECVSNLVNSSGTPVASMSGTFSSGSPVVTGLNNTSSMIVGQYLADAVNGEYLLTNKMPAGAKILTIDSSTQITMDVNAVGSGAQTVCFYGGVAPPNRVATCDGSATIPITNTDDLQLNMRVTGSGLPAGSFISSKVRNVSITLNNLCSLGATTLSFIPSGKTGIPGNGTAVGVTWGTVVTNNPNGYFANTAPTVAGGWLAADGGWPKNAVQSAFNLVQGGSSTLDARINVIKSVQINNDVYLFTNQ